MSRPTLRTPRLRLRPLAEADRESVVKVFADPGMSRFFAADFSDPSAANAMVDRRLAFRGPPGLGHWVIERAGEVVGVTHLKPSHELPGGVAELGYYIASAHAGQGLATEAAAAVVAHGLGTLGLPAVWALVHENNEASRKVASRLGFLDVGAGVHYGDLHRVLVALPQPHGRPHGIDLQVPDLATAARSWGWLLGELGWQEQTRSPEGVTWHRAGTYLAIAHTPPASPDPHTSLTIGVPTRTQLDNLTSRAREHGWHPQPPHPHPANEPHHTSHWQTDAGSAVKLVAPKLDTTP